ncbi:MAG: tRNA pseudouridine(55) synthase TruB [Caldicoprobacterales bacterium]|jgi:tRNA pseudouridine55 synthase|nr:tRNA pseudouridine(55) synthase TruB [Clostridiales bacterium]
MNGIINVLKPPGMTSSDVVVYLRRKLRINKAGHTGTLDPEAAGVLPVCLGKATRVADYLMHRDKVYRCCIRLGITTDTSDLTGTVLSKTDKIPDLDRVKNALSFFQGELEQIPPMYSAVKVKGKKLYELARQGIEIERKPRKIQIYKNNFLLFMPPSEILFETMCSKGTYIRALCRDIGEYLGCGAVMSYLIRVKSGEFSLQDSHTLEEIVKRHEEGKLETLLVSMEGALEPLLPSVFLGEECRKRISNGNQTGTDQIIRKTGNVIPGESCLVYCGSTFMGIGYISDNESRQVIRMKSVLI